MSGASGADVARAFAVAEGAFDLKALKCRIDALDGKVDAQIQIGLYTEIVSAKDDLEETIALYRAGVESLRSSYTNFISAEQAQEAEARISRIAVPGVPGALARDIGLLPLMGVAPEIAQLARTTGHDIAPVAALYFGVGVALGLALYG